MRYNEQLEQPKQFPTGKPGKIPPRWRWIGGAAILFATLIASVLLLVILKFTVIPRPIPPEAEGEILIVIAAFPKPGYGKSNLPGEIKQAIADYEKFLELSSTPSQREQAQQYLEQLREDAP